MSELGAATFRLLGRFLQIAGLAQLAAILFVAAGSYVRLLSPAPIWVFPVLAFSCALWWLIGNFLARLGK